MQTLYIYKEPFTGTIETTMQNNIIAYNDGLTFEQYNEKKGGNLKVATEDEIGTLLIEHENNNVLQMFTETTEERFWDGLECLPPKRWHKHNGLEIFFVGECYTSNIYRCYIHMPDAQKYYSALRRITETSDQLQATLLKSISNTDES